MIFGMTYLSLAMFILVVVGIVAWMVRLTTRPGESRAQKAATQALYSNQPWGNDKHHRSGNR